MAKAKPLPSRQELQEAFTYVPKTGLLYRNSTGEVAGQTKPDKLEVRLQSRYLAIHRVAWKMVTGRDPVETIDHINRDPHDNRWTNLREATRSQQCLNRKGIGKHLKGAYPKGDKWDCQIKFNGKRYKKGGFESEMEAHLHYCLMAEQRHGEFACLD